MTPTLETADSFNKSMSKFAKLVSVIRGILKANSVTKQEDLNSRRDDFIRDNLRMETNGAGVIVIDNKYEYTPITQKETPLPVGQLEFVRREIAYCVAAASGASWYALRIMSRTGNDPAALLGVILGFFGGELLLLCLKTVLKKDDKEEPTTKDLGDTGI